MYVGTLSFDLLLGDVRSLKEKRSVVRPIVAELQRKYAVSAAEVEHLDLHRRAGIGLAVALIPALAERPWTAEIGAGAVSAVIYYALVPTVGGFVLWYAGLARVSGAEAALFTALAPVSAVLLAFALLGEPVGLNQMIGIGCVLVAVLSLGWPRKPPIADRSADSSRA